METYDERLTELMEDHVEAFDVVTGVLAGLPAPIVVLELPQPGEGSEEVGITIAHINAQLHRAVDLVTEQPIPQMRMAAVQRAILDWITAYELIAKAAKVQKYALLGAIQYSLERLEGLVEALDRGVFDE